MISNLKRKYQETHFQKELVDGYSKAKEFSKVKAEEYKPTLYNYLDYSKNKSTEMFYFTKGKVEERLRKEDLIDTKYVKVKNTDEKFIFNVEIPKAEMKNKIMKAAAYTWFFK